MHIVALNNVILTVGFNVGCHSFMTSTKKAGGVIAKFWAILQIVVDGVLGGALFLTLLISTNPKIKPLPFDHKFFITFFDF